MPKSQTNRKKLIKVLQDQEAQQEKLDRKQRTFTGEDVGTNLIDYLGRTDRPADDPIERLVKLQQRLGEDVRDEMVQLIQDTNEAWNFRMVHSPSRTPEGGVTVRLVPASDRPTVDPVFNRQLLAWNQTLVLLERGMLNRVRKCAHCEKLFWARFSHSEYHDESCRLAAEAANPLWKDRRREYMRAQRKSERKGKA